VLLTIVSARHGKDSPPWPITQHRASGGS
jgi:hypothetical protein